MQGLCRKAVTLLLLAAFIPTTVFAQADKAILYPAPGLRLNGNSIQTSSAILSGDTVQTGSGSVQITGKGVMAQVDPDSTLMYGDIIVLACGGLTISTDSNGVQASDTRITPINGTARFQVVNRGGKLQVNVHSGTVRVASDETTTLSQGQSIDRPSSDGCPVLAAEKPSAPASTGKGKWILIGGAAGGGGALIWLLERKPSSPSAP